MTSHNIVDGSKYCIDERLESNGLYPNEGYGVGSANVPQNSGNRQLTEFEKGMLFAKMIGMDEVHNDRRNGNSIATEIQSIKESLNMKKKIVRSCSTDGRVGLKAGVMPIAGSTQALYGSDNNPFFSFEQQSMCSPVSDLLSRSPLLKKPNVLKENGMSLIQPRYPSDNLQGLYDGSPAKLTSIYKIETENKSTKNNEFIKGNGGKIANFRSFQNSLLSTDIPSSTLNTVGNNLELSLPSNVALLTASIKSLHNSDNDSLMSLNKKGHKSQLGASVSLQCPSLDLELNHQDCSDQPFSVITPVNTRRYRNSSSVSQTKDDAGYLEDPELRIFSRDSNSFAPAALVNKTSLKPISISHSNNPASVSRKPGDTNENHVATNYTTNSDRIPYLSGSDAKCNSLVTFDNQVRRNKASPSKDITFKKKQDSVMRQHKSSWKSPEELLGRLNTKKPMGDKPSSPLASDKEFEDSYGGHLTNILRKTNDKYEIIQHNASMNPSRLNKERILNDTQSTFSHHSPISPTHTDYHTKTTLPAKPRNAFNLDCRASSLSHVTLYNPISPLNREPASTDNQRIASSFIVGNINETESKLLTELNRECTTLRNDIEKSYSLIHGIENSVSDIVKDFYRSTHETIEVSERLVRVEEDLTTIFDSIKEVSKKQLKPVELLHRIKEAIINVFNNVDNVEAVCNELPVLRKMKDDLNSSFEELRKEITEKHDNIHNLIEESNSSLLRSFEECKAEIQEIRLKSQQTSLKAEQLEAHYDTLAASLQTHFLNALESQYGTLKKGMTYLSERIDQVIPEEQWHHLLESSQGDTLSMFDFIMKKYSNELSNMLVSINSLFDMQAAAENRLKNYLQESQRSVDERVAEVFNKVQKEIKRQLEDMDVYEKIIKSELTLLIRNEFHSNNEAGTDNNASLKTLILKLVRNEAADYLSSHLNELIKVEVNNILSLDNQRDINIRYNNLNTSGYFLKQMVGQEQKNDNNFSNSRENEIIYNEMIISLQDEVARINTAILNNDRKWEFALECERNKVTKLEESLKYLSSLNRHLVPTSQNLPRLNSKSQFKNPLTNRHTDRIVTENEAPNGDYSMEQGSDNHSLTSESRFSYSPKNELSPSLNDQLLMQKTDHVCENSYSILDRRGRLREKENCYSNKSLSPRHSPQVLAKSREAPFVFNQAVRNNEDYSLKSIQSPTEKDHATRKLGPPSLEATPSIHEDIHSICNSAILRDGTQSQMQAAKSSMKASQPLNNQEVINDVENSPYSHLLIHSPVSHEAIKKKINKENVQLDYNAKSAKESFPSAMPLGIEKDNIPSIDPKPNQRNKESVIDIQKQRKIRRVEWLVEDIKSQIDQGIHDYAFSPTFKIADMKYFKFQFFFKNVAIQYKSNIDEKYHSKLLSDTITSRRIIQLLLWVPKGVSANCNLFIGSNSQVVNVNYPYSNAAYLSYELPNDNIPNNILVGLTTLELIK